MHDGSKWRRSRTEIPWIARVFPLGAGGFAIERSQSTMKSFAPFAVDDRCGSAPSATW